jgi:hypothetical protein
MKIGAVIINRTKWIELLHNENITDNNKFWLLNLIMIANFGGKDEYGHPARGRIIGSKSGKKGISAAICYKMLDDTLNTQVINKHLDKLQEEGYITINTEDKFPYVQINNYDDWASS